jgi:hypothetical protein
VREGWNVCARAGMCARGRGWTGMCGDGRARRGFGGVDVFHNHEYIEKLHLRKGK